MRARNRVRRWVIKSGLPEDTLTGAARVTLCGRSCVMVEGQCGVVEMSDSRIRLRTRDGILSISGKTLVLQELSLDAAMIAGDRLETLTYGRLAREADN